MKIILPFLVLASLFHAILELAYYSVPESLQVLSLQKYWIPLESYDWALALFDLFIMGLLLFPTAKVLGSKFSLFLEICFRIGIGGMFIAASWFKIQQPGEFALLVAQYQLLPSFTVNLFSLFLPIFEFVLGVSLIISPWTKENSKIIFALFIIFIIALTQALIRDLGITCGCFEMEGAQDKSGAWTSLIRDLLLLYPCIFLIYKGTQRNTLSLIKEYLFQK